MDLLWATFGVGVVSSVLPFINMEAYILGVASVVEDPHVWLIAVAGGIGQALGKIPWYEVSRNSLQWSFVRKKLDDPRWAGRYEAVRTRVDDRPWVAFGVLFTSALVAIPPLAITAVLAGQLELNRPMFYTVIVIGRTVQFAALLQGVAVLTEL